MATSVTELFYVPCVSQNEMQRSRLQGRTNNEEAVMENVSENTQEAGRSPSQTPYVPLGMTRRDMLRHDPRYKPPVLATLMSIVPGLGQVYIGYYQQGFINVIVIAGLISLLAYYGISPYFKTFLAFFMAFYWLYNIVDAHRKSTFYNQALAGSGDTLDGEQLPGIRGSLAGALLMIVAGGIALSHTLFDLPIDWIERWWPMALILMGLYLLFQSLANKKKAGSR